MKKLILITLCGLYAGYAPAQNVTSANCQKLNNNTYCLSTKDGETVLTQDGKTMPGAVMLRTVPDNSPAKLQNRYCVQSTVWKKTIVMKEGEIVKGSVTLKDGAILFDDGEVIWADNSRTVLINGACIDDNGTIYGSGTEVVDKPVSVRKTELDVVVNNPNVNK